MLQDLRTPASPPERDGARGESGGDGDTGPVAEVWMGSHPRGPSILAETDAPLLRHLLDEPERRLGSRAAALAPPGDDQPGLPFLFKILTAEKGLSIQSHPTRERAAAGYAEEDRAGVPLDAPHRNYRDRNHKPELILALGDFWGLRGFRSLDELAREMAAFAAALVEPELGGLRRSLEAFAEDPVEERWKDAFAALVAPAAEGSGGAGTAVSTALCAALEGYAVTRGPAAADAGLHGVPPGAAGVDRDNRYWWCRELARQFPGDIGAVAPLYLNLFHLRPGEAVFLDAGILHAYLFGAGVEIMANSDNVLRAGCTPKHVDVPELLASLSFGANPAMVLAPEARPLGGGAGMRRFVTPAAEFELVELGGGSGPVDVQKEEGPAIILSIGGGCRITSAAHAVPTRLEVTESAFVDHETTGLRVEFDPGARAYVAALPGAISAPVQSARRGTTPP
jgi:mannose-6-phosphate isomerase